MKKFYSILSIAIAFSMLALTTSCSDDDDKGVNKTELLTAKKWSKTKHEIELQGQREDFGDIDECDETSYSTFSTDKVYTFVDICYGDEDKIVGTWEWKNGEKTLSWTEDWGADGIDTEEFELVSITATELVLKKLNEDFSMEIDGKTYNAYDIYTLTGK